MTPVAYAHPTISRFPIAAGMPHTGGLPVGLLAERTDATPFFAYQRTGPTRHVAELRRALPDDIHLVPRPSDTGGAVGVDRRPPGLHDR